MTHFGHCPACGTEIPPERQFNESIICECGWNASLKNKKESSKQIDRICISIALFAALLIGSFIHTVNWDKHFFTIIPLKAKQTLSVATADELRQISEICTDRKKWACSEEALKAAHQVDPADLTHLELLGSLQVKQNNMLSASKTYSIYFSNNGTNLDAKYNYAKALAAINDVKKAEKYFKDVLRAKPAILQITVTRHYISMLVKNDQLSKAKKVIEHFRRQGSNTGLFMNKEYKSIKQKLSRKVAGF